CAARHDDDRGRAHRGAAVSKVAGGCVPGMIGRCTEGSPSSPMSRELWENQTMTPTLQRFWRPAALALTLVMASALPHGAVAQQYPNRDIRFICAFPPGSGADVLVRFFAEQLRPIANRTIIVENRAGAG